MPLSFGGGTSNGVVRVGKMKILGIDYGDKRIGLALSDALGMMAHGRGIIQQISLEETLDKILDIIQTEGVKKVVVGLPKRLDNTIGARAKIVLEFVEKLKSLTDVSVITWDERLTTVQAEKILVDTGLSREKKRKHLNTVSAQLILQSYLQASSSS